MQGATLPLSGNEIIELEQNGNSRQVRIMDALPGFDNTLAADLADPAKGAFLSAFESHTVGDKLKEIISLSDKGGVADYAGTPAYDGADASRITATDNTAAFAALLTEAIARGDAVVHIPAGHWGIKTGQLSFSNFGNLRIVGAGIGVTILDFINEYAPVTGGGYVNNTTARSIAKFSIGDSIEFCDMTVKATTKGGLVNGAPGSNWVYEGAVWGFKLENVKTVRLTRVRAERFNYRGFSIYGTDTEKVLIDACEGFYNVGSGFWIEDADEFYVRGGEYAFNGLPGEIGTGYGVTGSTRVGNMIVWGGYYHHNYRKGLDTHGAQHFRLIGGQFQANVFSHVDILRYSSDPVGCTTQIDGTTFCSGIDTSERNWILAVYNQRKTNGYNYAGGHILRIVDTAAGKSARIDITGIKVRGHYSPKRTVGFAEGGPVPFQISATLGKLSWIGNEIDLDGYEFSASGTFGEHCLFEITAAEYEFKGGSLSCLADGSFTNTTSSLADTSNVFILQGVSTLTSKVSFDNWKLRANNLFLSSAASTVGTGATRQTISWANTERVMVGCDLGWINEPFTAFAPFERFNNANFLGNIPTSTQPAKMARFWNNSVITRGRAYQLPNDSLGVTSSRKPYAFSGITKATGAQVFSIVLDKQSGSMVRILTGQSGEELNITVYNGDFSGISGSGSNPYIEFDSADANYMVDGVAKLKLTVRAKVNLTNYNLFGEVHVYGRYPSFGIENIFLN